MRTRSPEKQTDAKQVITSLMDAMEEKQRELQEGARGDTEVPICTGFTAASPLGQSSSPCIRTPPPPGSLFKPCQARRLASLSREG